MPETTAPRENLLVNLICNIAVPTYVLTSLSKEEHLGPLWGLVLAILFPVSYGVYDFMRRRRTNFISIIGFFSVLLTGVVSSEVERRLAETIVRGVVGVIGVQNALRVEQ